MYVNAKRMESSNVIRSLPESFNIMINESVDIENDNPRDLIEILGNKLGVNDYTTNMVTFWLLDTIAYEIIQLRQKMNSKNLGLFISWIAGEAKLIQEKGFGREEFFREMKRIFDIVYKLIVEDRRSLIYWEEIDDLVSRSDEERNDHETIKADEKYDFSDIGPDDELRSIDSLNDDKINKINNNGKGNDSLKSDEEKNLSINLNQDRYQTIFQNPIEIFQSVVESTYKIYGNAFHFATVSAAFSQRTIKFVDHKLPYNLNFPRRVKQSLIISLPKEIPNKLSVNKKSKGKGKSDLNSVSEIPLPRPSITDDELIKKEKRKFILPLMESNEAARIIDDSSFYLIKVDNKNVVKKNNNKKAKK